MITFEEARKIAIDRIGPDYLISEDSITEKPYGWHFWFQHRKYVETGDYRYAEIGNGGFLVEKENGQTVEFPGNYRLEKNFQIYEKGLLGKNIDLVIIKVNDINLAIKLLHNLRMTYIEPEFAYGVNWKIPKEFSAKQIEAALLNLPHTFSNHRFWFCFETFKKIDDSGCLIYELKRQE